MNWSNLPESKNGFSKVPAPIAETFANDKGEDKMQTPV
jgi:hypothetical protein